MMISFGISVLCVVLAVLPTPIVSQGTCHCENGGECVYDASGAGIRCACPVGYRGILCDVQDANCQCENGGMCAVTSEGDYTCYCLEGYDGPLCQYVPNVEDTLPPDIFNCPSDFEARRQAGEDSVFVTWQEPYATDNSGVTPLVYRNVAPDFYAQSNYDVQVVYRYTDRASLTSECRFIISIIYSDGPDTRPILSDCPGDINVTAMGSLRTAVDWTEPTLASTGQEVIRVDRSHTPGSMFFLGRTTVTYMFLSNADLVVSQCIFTVTVFTDSCQCENGGVCIPDEFQTGVMCQCPAGYSGILCKDSDVGTCQCLNNGVCLYESSNTVMCSCPSGYRGVLCEEVDTFQISCQSQVAVSGAPGSTVTASIPQPTASGNTGQVSYSYTANGATISNPQAYQVVVPASGQSTVVVSIEAADVASNQQQSCQISIVVTAIVSPCVSSPCMNAASCVTTGNVYTCVCPAGFSGTRCEISDGCGCQNGGVCVRDVIVPRGTRCICPDGFSGILCDQSTTVDTVPPTVTFCPESFNLNLTSSDPIAATWPQPEAEDDSGLAPSVDQNVPMGTLINPGDVLDVVYKFTDAAGNVAFCNFTVIAVAAGRPCASSPCQNGATCVTTGNVYTCVCPAGFTGTRCEISDNVDTVPPTITFCPESFNLNLTSSDPIAATWPQPEAEDDSGLVPSVDQNVPVGTLMSLGDTLDVSYKFTDGAGNFAFCNFTVNAVDVVPPEIQFCPPDIENLAPNPTARIFITWAVPQVSDNSGGLVQVLASAEPGIFVMAGSVQIVSYIFTDESGNQARCMFTISIIVLESPESVSVIDVTTTSAMLSVVPPNATFDSYVVKVTDQELTFPATETILPLSGLMPGTSYQVSVITALSTFDEFTSEPFNLEFFTVPLDMTPPVVTGCPSDITLPAGQNVANWTEPTAVDNSGLVPAVNKSHEPGAIFADESTNVSYTFTDAAGNTAKCVFTVTRILVLAPPISVSLINVTTTSGLLSLVPPNVTFDLYIVRSQTLAINATFPATESTIKLPGLMPGTNYAVSVSTAVAYGTENEVISDPVSVDFTTVALDMTPPVVAGCPSDITLPVGQNVANWTEPTAVDNSGLVPAVNKSHEPGAVFADESTNVSYTFTDAAGNTAKCVFTVTRILVLAPPISVSLINVTTTSALISLVPPNVTFDLYIVRSQTLAINATFPAMESTIKLPGLMPGTNYTVSVSTAVAYGTNNEVISDPVSVDFTTVALDMTPPVVTGCPSDITLPAGQNVANWTEPTAVDNSGLVPVVNKSHEPGAVFADESTNVSYTFTDAAGNTAKCVFTVTRILVLAPPASIRLVNVTSTFAMVTVAPPNVTFDTYLVTVQSEDSRVNVTFPSTAGFLPLPDLVPATNYTMAISTAVAYGMENEAVSEPVTIDFSTDPIPVIMNCPSDVSLNVSHPSGVVYGFWIEPTAVSGREAVPFLSRSRRPGSSFGQGTTQVTYVFQDSKGYEAQCSFMVMVTLVMPVMSIPPDSIDVVGITPISALVTWMGPSVTFDSYLVTLSGPSATDLATVDPSESSLALFGLMPGTNYTVQIATVIGSGNSQLISEPIVTSFQTVALDMTPPVVIGCPSDITLPAGQNLANWTEPTAVDNSGLVPAVNKSHEPGAVFADESTNVIYTFTDAAGNTAKCVFTVTRLFDVTPPVVSGCPGAIILPLGETIANWTEPTATDDSGLPPTVMKSHQPGTSFLEGTTNVTYTFTDGAGNQATCEFTVTVTIDVTPPVVSGCPGAIILPLGETIANWTEPTATDDSGLPSTVTKSHLPGTSFLEGTTNVTYTFTDGAGNQATCEFTVTITFDVTRPVFSSCPGAIILPLGETIANWTEPTATDDSGLPSTVTKSHLPGTSFLEGTTNVTYTFTDGAGNQATCEFTVTVTFDVTRPVFSSCPGAIILPLGETIANWTEPTATDDSGLLPTVSKSHQPGTSFLEGNTNVTYTFTDGAGNQATCEFTVTVTFDVTPPVVSGCPGAIILPLGETIANWTEPTATDDSGLPPTVLKSHQPGTSFLEGTTNVTYTFTDGAGNQATCEFTVTVTFDTTAPVVTSCPGNIMLPFASTLANWTEPTAMDNSGHLPTLTKTHEPGTEFSDGNTTVVYTFTDAAGNQANCSFLVTVVVDDVVPLIMNCPSNITLPFGTEVAVWTEPTATDNSGHVPSLDQSHQPGAVFTDDSTMVTYTFTDASGNQANCVFLVIRLRDMSPPEVTSCPSVINLPPGTNVATWDEPTATDNSGGVPAVSSTHQSGSVFTKNTTMVVYTFTDAAGNEALCVFFVKLAPVDLPPVVFNCPSDINMTLRVSEIDQGILSTWREPYAVDDSGVEPTVNQTHSPGIMFPAGSTEVVYTFTDIAGNQAECIFVVNVLIVDDIPPVITGCPANMNPTLPLTQQSDLVVTWQEPSATDNSGVAPSLNRSHQSGQAFPEGVTTVTYSFTDKNGNQAVCSFEINVQREEDITPPQILNCPLDQAYVIPAGNQFMIIMWNPPSAVDNSGLPPVSVSNRIPGDVFGVGETVVMYNFTDPSGNLATCEFTITLSNPALNPCQTNPCRPNESCFYSASEYICVAGPFRKRREVLDLKDDAAIDFCPCENRGVCHTEAETKGTRCVCPEGLSGIFCQEEDKITERAPQLYWMCLGLICLGAVCLLVVVFLAVFHRKRHQTSKLGYDLSTVAL